MSGNGPFSSLEATKSVNRPLEANAQAPSGLTSYVTNPDSATAEFMIGSHHRLFQIEKSFRMSKHDLRAPPIYHHERESIVAR